MVCGRSIGSIRTKANLQIQKLCLEKNEVEKKQETFHERALGNKKKNVL
jgi:hypothetical protein